MDGWMDGRPLKKSKEQNATHGGARGGHSDEAKAVMQDFWNNFDAYPSRDELDALAAKSGLTAGPRTCSHHILRASTRRSVSKAPLARQ